MSTFFRTFPSMFRRLFRHLVNISAGFPRIRNLEADSANLPACGWGLNPLTHTNSIGSLNEIFYDSVEIRPDNCSRKVFCFFQLGSNSLESKIRNLAPKYHRDVARPHLGEEVSSYSFWRELFFSFFCRVMELSLIHISEPTRPY